ncbi:MAG TPA: RNA 2'-phosphotransferase [Blastocatellia bacterium]|nr:RNA 2'-phosphotransferase [Blastocatellia bacterium]
MNNREVKISKFLSLVLRHQPQKIGLTPDKAGWIGADELLAACQAHGFPLTLEELNSVVRNNDKQRFAFSEDGRQIRASQGHSIEVELDYQPAVPPAVLYHGTPERFLDSIRAKGLVRGRRHHVHLSADAVTAVAVGERRGRPVVLEILSGQMHRDGYQFFQSANGVWLTEHVPAQYIVI